MSRHAEDDENTQARRPHGKTGAKKAERTTKPGTRITGCNSMSGDENLLDSTEEFIRHNAGCCLEDIVEHQRITYSKARRLVEKLCNEKRIAWTKQGRKKHFFVPSDDMIMFAILKPLCESPGKKKVVEFLIDNKNSPQYWRVGDIARGAGIGYGQALRMVKNLDEKLILVCEKGESGYILEPGEKFEDFIQVGRQMLNGGVGTNGSKPTC